MLRVLFDFVGRKIRGQAGRSLVSNFLKLGNHFGGGNQDDRGAGMCSRPAHSGRGLAHPSAGRPTLCLNLGSLLDLGE